MWGVVVLFVAVTALLTVRQLVGGGVTGAARPMELPRQPAVGSCVDLQGSTAVVIQCAGEHDAEVMLSWPAWQQPPASSLVTSGHAAPLISQGLGLPDVAVNVLAPCLEVSDSYLHPNASTVDNGWLPTQPVLSIAVARTAESHPGAGNWFVCLAAESRGAPYSGSLRELLPVTARWAAGVGHCWQSTWEGEPAFVSCGAEHRGEVLGYWTGNVAGELGSEVVDQCVELAKTMLLTGDPTYGGQLRIRVGYLAGNNATPNCLAEVAGDGSLSGSIIGLGADPLPAG